MPGISTTCGTDRVNLMSEEAIVCDQILQTAEQLIAESGANESDVYSTLMRVCESRFNRALALDPGRND